MMPADALTDPRFHRALTQMVRRRVPESDAEDIVQSALAEALASPSAPADTDAMRRFVWGIARHKVADFYRRARRERLELTDVEGAGAPHSEADLLRWAARELPPGKDAEQTLEWMLREGEGEKLEAIAESENLPAPRVRQRVSRLRRHLRERWALEVAALAALGIVVALVVWQMTRRPGAPITKDVPGPAPTPAPSALPAPPNEPPRALPGTSDVPSVAPSAPAPLPSTPPRAVPSTAPSAARPSVPSTMLTAPTRSAPPNSTATPPPPKPSAPKPTVKTGPTGGSGTPLPAASSDSKL